MKKALTLATFAVIAATAQLVAGLAFLPAGGSQRCADLVADQTATKAVVPGAYECTAGAFRNLLVEYGWDSDAKMAGGSPATGGPVQFLGQYGSRYVYLLAGSVTVVTEDSAGKVIDVQ